MRCLLWVMTALCGALTACLPPPMGAPPTPLANGEVELGAGGLYEHHLAERPGELLCAPMTPSCSGPSGVYWARMRPMLHRNTELGVTMSAGYSPTMLLYDGPASIAAARTLRLWVEETPQRTIGLELQLTPSWVTLGAMMSAQLSPSLSVWARPNLSPLSAKVPVGLSYITASGLVANAELSGGVIFAAPLFGLPEDDRVGLDEWLEHGPQRAYPLHLGLSFSHAFTPERRAPR